jgi:hypothetical protein
MTASHEEAPEGSGRMLRLSWVLRGGAVGLVAFAVAVAALAARGAVRALWDGELQPLVGLVVFLGGTAVVAVGVLGWGWWVDGRGLEQRSLLRRRHGVPWAEITGVNASAVTCFLHRGRAAPLRFSASVVGYGVLARFILERVSPQALGNEATRRALQAVQRRGPSLFVLPPDRPPPADAGRRRWRENPFHVLGLAPDCSAADVERTGQKLLGLLALELASGRSYATPVGPAERTADMVRAAMAELRDPERRLRHEVWAALPVGEGAAASPASRHDDEPWDAMAALRWRAP